MSRKKEILPQVSSQGTEEKNVRKKSRVKESPHQTSEPETDKFDLKDLDATAKHAQKKSIASRKKKQVKDSDSSLESSLTSKSKNTTELTPEAVTPETTKPKRKRRTKAEMEAARKELEKNVVDKTKDEKTEEPEKKKRRKKVDVTEDVKKEAKPKETKKKITPKEISKESEHTEPNPKPEHKDSKKKANQKEMNNESMRNEEQNKVVPTEAQTKKTQTEKETQTASKPVKKPKKSRKKELIYAVCLKNGGEMVVEEAGEKTRKKYEGAMYELMISDTLAVLKKSEVPSARIKPMEEDMYYEINDDLYHVEFYRNGRRIG